VSAYRLLLDLEVIRQVESFPKRTRVAIFQRLEAIRQNPDHWADYGKESPGQRRLEVHVFGKFAIEYWIDFADRHVKVFALRAADRGDRT
jgi:hypothetical protein